MTGPDPMFEPLGEAATAQVFSAHTGLGVREARQRAAEVLAAVRASVPGVLGLPGLGTLAVGQAADFAVHDLDDPRHFGLHDSAIGPVASGGRTMLRALVCDGRVVVEHGTIPGLDLAALRREAAALVRRMAFD